MFKDDIEWVRSQISRLPPAYHKKAADSYAKVYTEAYAEKAGYGELIQIQHARTTANTRLRRYVQAVNKKLSQTKLDS